MAGLYHYTQCGLADVYLSGGVTERIGKHGKTIYIEDIEGLHRAIGHYLAKQKKHLSGREVRFLRHEMGLSQAMLAMFLGKDEQSVARWEKKRLEDGETIPPDSERMIRLLYLEHLGDNPSVRKFLEQLAELEDLENNSVSFRETDAGWETAA